MACAAVPRVLRLILDWDMVFTGQVGPGRCRDVRTEELPLTPSTIEALWRLNKAFWDYQEGPDPVDPVDELLVEEEGLRLWQVVRDELGPSYHVTYCSVLHGDFETPEEYERVVGDERRRPYKRR
jgi:hypothetical protein